MLEGNSCLVELIQRGAMREWDWSGFHHSLDELIEGALLRNLRMKVFSSNSQEHLGSVLKMKNCSSCAVRTVGGYRFARRP